MILKKCKYNFKKRYNINALHRPSKLAIAEVASMSGGRDILYHNVATETDHTVADCRTNKYNLIEMFDALRNFGIV